MEKVAFFSGSFWLNRPPYTFNTQKIITCMILWHIHLGKVKWTHCRLPKSSRPIVDPQSQVDTHTVTLRVKWTYRRPLRNHICLIFITICITTDYKHCHATTSGMTLTDLSIIDAQCSTPRRRVYRGGVGRSVYCACGNILPEERE